MSVPYEFADRSGRVPGSYLDVNFAYLSDAANLDVNYPVADLAALKALVTRPGAVTVQTGKAAGTWRWEAGSSTTADDALVVQCTSGDAGRYKRIYSKDAILAEWWGVTADGAARDDLKLQTCIGTFAPYPHLTTGGVKIILPRGRLRFEASVDLADASGVHILGSGMQATECFATGDFPVFTATGTSSAPWVNASIKDMTIRGGGKANTSAHGVSFTFINGVQLENIYFLSCRRAVNVAHMYQCKFTFLQGQGQGADQNYDGLFLDNSDLTNIDNAVWAFACNFQAVENDAFRIINGQGSKFIACEATFAGRYGWNVHNPATGSVKSQWLHFSHCLSDKSGSANWNFEKGNATEAGEWIMTGTWTGSSGDEGMILNELVDVDILGIVGFTLAKECLKLIGCTRVTVTGITARQYNNANGGHPCVTLEDSTSCVIFVGSAFTTNAVNDVIETGSSNFNDITSPGSATLVGASSSAHSFTGAFAERWRRAGDVAISLIGGAGNTAYIGLGTAADELLHNIQRTSSGSIEVHTNAGRRFSFGSGIGATGFKNTSDQPLEFHADTVANLNAIGFTTGGIQAYATDGRNSGEGAGSGTGCPCYTNNTGTLMACWSGLAVTT